MSGQQGDRTGTENPELAALRAEREQMRAGLEQLRTAANNNQFDPERPLRDYTAPDPETIQL